MNFDDFPHIKAEGHVYAHVKAIPGRRNCTYCSRAKYRTDKFGCTDFVDSRGIACASPNHGGFVTREHFDAYVVEVVKVRMGVGDDA